MRQHSVALITARKSEAYIENVNTALKSTDDARNAITVYKLQQWDIPHFTERILVNAQNPLLRFPVS